MESNENSLKRLISDGIWRMDYLVGCPLFHFLPMDLLLGVVIAKMLSLAARGNKRLLLNSQKDVAE